MTNCPKESSTFLDSVGLSNINFTFESYQFDLISCNETQNMSNGTHAKFNTDLYLRAAKEAVYPHQNLVDLKLYNRFNFVRFIETELRNYRLKRSRICEKLPNWRPYNYFHSIVLSGISCQSKINVNIVVMILTFLSIILQI